MYELWLTIQFYFLFILIGLLGYVILRNIFKEVSNALIYTISKTIGLIILGYPIWLLSSIKILNFSSNTIVQIIFFILLISTIIYQIRKSKIKNLHSLTSLIKKNQTEILKIILIELVGLILYLSYLYIRAFRPELSSTEKPMDILMLSSAGKTDFFPFFDPWWSENLVNYYYYGFYLFALVLKLGDIPYTIGYNLSLGFIFSQTFIIAGAIAHYFTKSIKAAIISGLFINFAGNLHYTNCLIQNYNKDLNIECYYPKATRILDPAYTINEITSYSFVLGDLHPHVLSIIFFLTCILLILLIGKHIKDKYKLILLAISMASTAMINFWDFFTLGIIYFFIMLILFFIKPLKIKKINLNLDLEKLIKNIFNKIIQEKKLIPITIFLAISPYIFFLPFFSHFESPVEGIGFSPQYISIMKSLGIQIEQYPSTFGFLFGIWGGFWIIIIFSLMIKFYKLKKVSKNLLIIIAIFLISNFLILITELFFFKDMFHYINPNYFRSNTVFKLTYHSWILMSILTGIAIAIAIKKLKELTFHNKYFIILDIVFSNVLVLMIFAKLIYPFFSFNQFYAPELSLQQTQKLTLDGSIYVKYQNTADYETIKWINKNEKKRVILVEAVGSAYSYFGRISSNTGMGNIINWETHQWTWRFKYPENVKDYKELLKNRSINHISDLINIRQNDVKKIYESLDIENTKELLKRYKVKYVYIGDLEKQNYNVQESKFYQIGKVVFEYNNSKLFLITI